MQKVDEVKIHRLKSIDLKVYPDQIHKVPERARVFGREMPRAVYRHGLRASVFSGREVRKILEKFRPDVVHVQVADPMGCRAVKEARRLGIPVVSTEHNQPEVLTDSLKMPRLMKTGANKALSRYFRGRFLKSDFVTMPTERAIRVLIGAERRALEVPVAAVSNGVDLSRFRPGKRAEVPTVVYVGRIDPEKRVGTILKSFAKLLEKISTARMVVAGDGVDLARVKKLAVELNIAEKVDFRGKVVAEDLVKIYQEGWIFATASPIETQGIVLIEAAATGLPLIAVDAGAVAEVCRNNENGILVPAFAKDLETGGEKQEVAAIAEAMIKILSDEKLRAKFAEKSQEIAHEHDFGKTLDKFENIYRKVCEQKAGE